MAESSTKKAIASVVPTVLRTTGGTGMGQSRGWSRVPVAHQSTIPDRTTAPAMIITAKTRPFLSTTVDTSPHSIRIPNRHLDGDKRLITRPGLRRGPCEASGTHHESGIPTCNDPKRGRRDQAARPRGRPPPPGTREDAPRRNSRGGQARTPTGGRRRNLRPDRTARFTVHEAPCAVDTAVSKSARLGSDRAPSFLRRGPAAQILP